MDDEEVVKCPVCETDIDEDSEKCPNCGITKTVIHLERNMDEDLNGDIDDIFDHIEDDLIEAEEHEVTSLIKTMSSIGFGDESKVSMESHESEEGSEELVFECPICGEEVGENDTECPGCGAIFETGKEEEEDLRDEFEDVFKKAKKKLADARKLPLCIDVVKDLVRQATIAKNEEDFDRGIERASEAIQVCYNIEEFLELVKEIKGEIKKKKERGEEFKKELQDILQAKEEVEKGKVINGLKMAKEVKKSLES